MKHKCNYRKLGRRAKPRMALLRNLLTSLLTHGKIVTTLAKAKELRPFAEKCITKIKKSGNLLHIRRSLLDIIYDKALVATCINEFPARYATRNGGYTRVMKYGFRKGDNAPMAIIEMLDD